MHHTLALAAPAQANALTEFKWRGVELQNRNLSGHSTRENLEPSRHPGSAPARHLRKLRWNALEVSRSNAMKAQNDMPVFFRLNWDINWCMPWKPVVQLCNPGWPHEDPRNFETYLHLQRSSRFVRSWNDSNWLCKTQDDCASLDGLLGNYGSVFNFSQPMSPKTELLPALMFSSQCATVGKVPCFAVQVVEVVAYGFHVQHAEDYCQLPKRLRFRLQWPAPRHQSQGCLVQRMGFMPVLLGNQVSNSHTSSWRDNKTNHKNQVRSWSEHDAP